MSYQKKYLKYKIKYLNLKKMLGGDPNCDSYGTKLKISTGFNLDDVIKSGCKIGDFVQGNDKDNKKLMNIFIKMFKEKKIKTTEFLKVYSSDNLKSIMDEYTKTISFSLDPFKLYPNDIKDDKFFENITFEDLIKLYDLYTVWLIYCERNKGPFTKDTFFEYLIRYNLKEGNKKITLSTLLDVINRSRSPLVFADMFFSDNKNYEIFNSFWDTGSVTHGLFSLLFKDYLKDNLHTNFGKFLLKKLLIEKINTVKITTFFTTQSKHFNLKNQEILEAFKIIYNTEDLLELKRQLFVWAKNKIKNRSYPEFNNVYTSPMQNFLILIYEGFGIEDFMKKVTTEDASQNFNEYVKLKDLIPDLYSRDYVQYIYNTVPTVKIFVDEGFIINQSFIDIARKRGLEDIPDINNANLMMNILKYGSAGLDMK